MIEVKCITNLDEFKTAKWPTLMVCRPELGDSVHAVEEEKILIVRSIAHRVKIAGDVGNQWQVPYLEIYLGARSKI